MDDCYISFSGSFRRYKFLDFSLIALWVFIQNSVETCGDLGFLILLMQWINFNSFLFFCSKLVMLCFDQDF